MLADDPEPLNAALTPLILVLVSAAVMAASGWCALLARRARLADRVGALVLSGGALAGLAGVALWLVERSPATLVTGSPMPWGGLSVCLDGLGAAFLLPLLAVPALASIYGAEYWSQERRGASAKRARIFMGFLAASLAILPVARDGVLFLMAFEAMTLSAFFLITTEDEQAEAREAGWVYFVASHVSLMFLFAALALYRAATGGFELTASAAAGMSPGAATGVFLLILVGFGVKAGVMPLHVWLPGAHASAPSHVSAVLSGVVIKVGVYGLVRFTAILPDPPMFWGLLVLLAGAASGIGGVAYALGQHDLKRLLAYHSIENIGIIAMGLGVALLGRWAQRPELVALGMACTVMHVWNHALFKSLLFLSAGAVVHAAGTREIDRMGGLGRGMPWSAGLFTLGAVAICGLPPLNGFVSEFFLFSAAMRGLTDGAVGVVSGAAPVLALIGAMAAACFIKVVGCVFLGSPRSDQAGRAHECGRLMRAPMLGLAVACAALGLAPVLGAPVLDGAAAAWAMPSPAPPALGSIIPFGTLAVVLGALLGAAALATVVLSRRRGSVRSGTWDCGFAAPSGRMQYTGSSLARGLVQLFGAVLGQVQHPPEISGPFPRPAAYRGHVEDAVMSRVLAPLFRGFAGRCARVRQWQTGRIQAYIVYVLLTTLALLLLVVPVLKLLERLVTI